MDDKKYITESIFLLNDQTFYEENGKMKIIKKHNWHHILNEYGWEKLPKQWIKILNSYLDKPIKNSLYGSLDCGGEGDCLFHCISYVFNETNMNEYENFDSHDLRVKISEKLTKERYEDLIELYKIMNQANDFDEMWNPEEITMDNFKGLLVDGGDNFWGDFLSLSLIKETLNINIIMLNSNEITDEYYNYPLFYEYDKDLKTIILLYENEIHFKLVGNFQGSKMIFLFNHKNIPKELLKLINYLR
jgi:hypothetical protein